jgi:hypothetical protein
VKYSRKILAKKSVKNMNTVDSSEGEPEDVTYAELSGGVCATLLCRKQLSNIIEKKSVRKFFSL